MGICASACTACCGAMCKVGCCGAGKTRLGSKIIYLVIMFVIVLLGVAVRVWGDEIYGDMYSFDDGCPEKGNSGRSLCLGMMGVYRVSWSLFTFFLLMALGTFAWRGFHTGMWFLKIPVLFVFLIYPFFIPNDFFEGYSHLARVGSVLFLALQALILIAFAYDLSDGILARAQAYDDKLEAEGYEANLLGNCWKVLYVAMSGGTLIAAIVGCVLLYFIPPSCPLNTFFVSQTIILGLAYTILSATNLVGVGLLPPAIMFAHSAFLTWSAIRSNPDEECNDAAADSSVDGILIGVLAAAASLTWASCRMGDAVYDAFRCNKDKDAEEQARRDEEADRRLQMVITGDDDADSKPAAQRLTDDDDDDDDGGKKKKKKKMAFGKSKDDDDEDEENEEKPDDQVEWPFHLVMALGGLYFGMLLTNWGDLESTELTAALELSDTSMWVKMISQWLSIVLFVWTMLAAKCCKSRDFD